MTRFPPLAVAAVLLSGCNGFITDAGGGGTGRGPGLDPRDPEFCSIAPREPGHVTMRRLNRVEYDHTVQDLLGTSLALGAEFPADDESGDGFDNNGEILSLGPLLIERYDDAARALVADALAAGSPARERYLSCDVATAGEEACARELITSFGLRAFRRPVLAEEATRLVALFTNARAEGEGFDASIGLVMRAMLISPSFMFRIELGTDGAAVAPVDPYALASRLSYFLWSSMPDDELFDLAESGLLADETELREQVERMLDDPKADRFYESFAGQWLHLRRFAYARPDAAQFPEFDEALRGAMEQETLMFVRHVVETNAPVSTLLRADYTFLNERLATHYGIEGVTGPEMRLVMLDTDARGGLLTQGSILTVTSHPDVTSPVKRGQWVLDQLLCEPPPDPPPDVDTFLETEETAGLTRREQLERHRADPVCATCHNLMDPIGFGMESYDPVGAFRTLDNGHEVDASGTLPDGQSFVGVAELSTILHEDERYTRCVTEKLVTYALGRSLETADRCFVDDIVARASASDLSVRELIVETVLDDVFRSAGGRAEAP